MKTRLIPLLVLFFLVSTIAFAQSDTIKQVDLKYGKYDRNTLDLYLPPKANPAMPFVILIHGGAWVQSLLQF